MNLLIVGFGILVVFFAGMVQGCTAFGYGLIAFPLLLLLLPVKTAVIIITISAVFIFTQLVWSIRKNLNIKAIILLIVFGATGSLVGTILLLHVDSGLLKLFAGLLIVIFSICLAIGIRVNIKTNGISQAVVGLLSGLLQGSLSIGGPPVVLFYTNQGVNKDIFRANVSFYLYVLMCFTLIFQIFSGVIVLESIKYSLVLLPAAIVGNFIGIKLSKKLPEEIFKKIVLILVFISGVSCIIF